MGDLASFGRFGLVGAVGFAVDAGLLQLLCMMGWDPIVARCVALPLAVLSTWLLNRSFTFPEAQEGPWWPSLVRYVGVSALGASVNFVVYSALVFGFAAMARHPAAAVAVGSAVALFVNYLGSKHFAFRRA